MISTENGTITLVTTIVDKIKYLYAFFHPFKDPGFTDM